MKAVYIAKPNHLEYVEVPIPKPKEGEVLIRVKACALNHLDLHLLKGRFNLSLPHIPGSDVAGVIEKINGKNDLKVGQAIVVNPAIPCGQCSRCKQGLSCEIVNIFGYKTLGGYAQYVTVPTEQVYLKPKNLSFVEAAAFPLTFLTAYHMLVGRANLQKNEVVFIWGASGGLGSAAIQIAKHIGAKIITTVSQETDAKKIKKLGTLKVINYKKENIEQSIKKLTNGEKADVVFESVGAKTWKTSLSILRPHGRLVLSGVTSGAIASQDLSDIYYYQQTILGARMGTKEEFEKVLKLVELGKLKPVIDKIFPLKEANKAIKRLSESKQFGKIVLEC